MAERYFDASNQIAGRLASVAAKQLLNGDSVFIINAEKAVVSGDRVYTENLFKEKHDRGDMYHGPFYPREPEKMLGRMIRGMLPFHTARGKEAFRRLRVYKSVPAELKGRKFEKPAAEGRRRAADAAGRLGSKRMEIGEISVKLGAKKLW
ncbi:MAG: 50S ribosomal protein L13 [Candidatus Aenigmarchaeota archaeon]|nr:50S ribosomal protein L13 [Candidatus Aenigmarchaeota archaeon]